MHATSRVGGAFRLASLLDPSLPSGKPRAPRHLKPCSTDTWRPRAHAEVGPWRSPSAPAERARIDSSGGDRTPTATASGRERQVEAPWPRVPGDISCSDPTDHRMSRRSTDLREEQGPRMPPSCDPSLMPRFDPQRSARGSSPSRRCRNATPPPVAPAGGHPSGCKPAKARNAVAPALRLKSTHAVA